MQNNVKWDLGWGNPYFLLEVLDKEYKQKLSPYDIKKMNYAPNNGMHKLIRLTRNIIKEITGLDYKYITITNGATHAISSILRYYKSIGYENVLTNKYTYPYYESLILRAGLSHTKFMFSGNTNNKTFRLIDSPSNPKGEIFLFGSVYKDILDAVYFNKIYTNFSVSLHKKYPYHYAMVGSYSKLLGLTGARVGFIASNHIFFHEMVGDWALKDNATVSVPSQELIIDILEKINLNKFMAKGNKYLNNNREEFQKIEYLFGGQRVNPNGMFYFVGTDQRAKRLLKKCGINFISMDDEHIRLNIGQTKEVVKNSIKEILKKDGKKYGRY